MPGAQRRGSGAGGERRDRRDNRRGDASAEKSTYIERVVAINRVAKVVQGGRRFSFTAPRCGRRWRRDARRRLRQGQGGPGGDRQGLRRGEEDHVQGAPHPGHDPASCPGREGGGVVLLRPARPGTGVIAGGPVRAVLECAGIRDILSKSLGSDNPINVVHATVKALRSLEQPEDVAARRGLPVEDVAPAALLRARASTGA